MTQLSPKEKSDKLAMGVRRILIMALGLVEDWMELDRSIVPRRKRKPLAEQSAGDEPV